jgi:hypothetical protein
MVSFGLLSTFSDETSWRTNGIEMIRYSGMIFVCAGDDPKEYDFGDVGPNFSFGSVKDLVQQSLKPWAIEVQILPEMNSAAIAFHKESNHDHGLREELLRMLGKLADLGTGIHALCSMDDDEANDGKGGTWELRLNHPNLGLDGTPVERIDLTRRDW